jgi:transaldolase
MASKLDQLREMTTVVADTGDIEAVRRLKPVDCTTNPSIVLKALGTPEFEDTMSEAITWGNRQNGGSEARVAAVADRLAVSVGAMLADIVPGRVSTEVDADLSFDTKASIARAEAIIDDYAERQIGRERILVKLASTWEGIRAAEDLQDKGIDCNLTLLFSKAQAIACADAGAFLISPFVGRIYDWYRQAKKVDDIPIADDPGVASVTRIYRYFKKYGYKTLVMGASFRKAEQIVALAGCDLLTISPDLLEKLSAADGEIARALSPEDAGRQALERVTLDEKAFRWMHNEDQMAVEKLSEGIRRFNADARKLEQLVFDLVKDKRAA